jgi:hypothetical protein
LLLVEGAKIAGDGAEGDVAIKSQIHEGRGGRGRGAGVGCGEVGFQNLKFEISFLRGGGVGFRG